jgi:glycosyltransferase involved in cell wall biosynthesis
VSVLPLLNASVLVVIPVMKFDSWLSEAVMSVLASTEGNVRVRIVHEHGVALPRPDWAGSPRVEFFLARPGEGLASALSQALEVVDAEFIARLDADDISLPARIETQMAAFMVDPNLVVCGSFAVRIDENGVETGMISPRSGLDVRSDLLRRNQLVHSTVMMRTSAYRAVGGYNPSLRFMEDYELWLRLGALGPIRVIPLPLAQYRVHSGQVSVGSPPKGAHIFAIRKAGQRLGTTLGIWGPVVSASFLVWLISQYLRVLGVRKIGYLRGVPNGDV